MTLSPLHEKYGILQIHIRFRSFVYMIFLTAGFFQCLTETPDFRLFNFPIKDPILYVTASPTRL